MAKDLFQGYAKIHSSCKKFSHQLQQHGEAYTFYRNQPCPDLYVDRGHGLTRAGAAMSTVSNAVTVSSFSLQLSMFWTSLSATPCSSHVDFQ